MPRTGAASTDQAHFVEEVERLFKVKEMGPNQQEGRLKRAAIYTRISTADQNATTQLLDLRQLAEQRGYEIVAQYSDIISGAKSRRPGLGDLMRDARRGRFDAVLVWSSDRIARSVKHFLEVLDELNRLQVEFISFRENLDTCGPLGRAVITIISVVAELERSLIVERVRAGMRRARLEGRHIGRRPLELDREAILCERRMGYSFRKIAKEHRVSTATIQRVLKDRIPVPPSVQPHQYICVTKGLEKAAS